jgi:hypothetical protein
MIQSTTTMLPKPIDIVSRLVGSSWEAHPNIRAQLLVAVQEALGQLNTLTSRIDSLEGTLIGQLDEVEALLDEVEALKSILRERDESLEWLEERNEDHAKFLEENISDHEKEVALLQLTVDKKEAAIRECEEVVEALT